MADLLEGVVIVAGYGLGGIAVGISGVVIAESIANHFGHTIIGW